MTSNPLPLRDIPRRNPIPEHCRYKVGDWVRMHANPKAFPRGINQHGWRGYITGYAGATVLTGLTDDGREWDEYWGALEPDQPRPPEEHCVCCPRARIPGDLFEPGGVLVTRRDAMWWRSRWGARSVAELWDGSDDYPAVIS